MFLSKSQFLTIILNFFKSKVSMASSEELIKAQADQLNSLKQKASDLRLATGDKFQKSPKKVEQLRQFIKLISQFKDKHTQNIIFKYCGQYENWEVDSNHILMLLDKRIERMIKNKKVKRNWSQGDMIILVWIFQNVCRLHNIESFQNITKENWQQISDLIPGTTPNSCMFKILGLKKVKLSDQQWNEQESFILSKLVNITEKTNWKEISQQLYLCNSDPKKLFRNAKQCKQHWCCYLNPNLKKGPWNIEEDIKLMQNVYENKGKKRWSTMCRILKGRTQNALKNRFSLIINRYKHRYQTNKNFSELKQIKQSLNFLLEEKNQQVAQKNNLNKNQIRQQNPPFQPQIEKNENNNNGTPQENDCFPIIYNNPPQLYYCLITPTYM